MTAMANWGFLDHEIYLHGMQLGAYAERRLTVPREEVQRTVALMISAVARDQPAWLWKGVGAVNR